MEEMIKRIVDMDKRAREITEPAQREKLECEKVISERAAQLREEVLSQAYCRIQINKELENIILEQAWAKTKARYDEHLTHMDSRYNEHGLEWVDAIFERVLQG